MIKIFVRDNAFTECNVFQFILFINNCLSYIITFFINFVRLKHFVIKKIIDKLNVEFDIIKIQSIRYENNLILLFKSFILRDYKFKFNYSSKDIYFEIL